MASVTYNFTPGQSVFVVKPATFGIGRAVVVSVQITADPLSTKYVVQYLAAGRVQALVDETEIFATLLEAQTAYGPLVI